MSVTQPPDPSAFKYAVPGHAAVRASPFVGSKSINKKLVVHGGGASSKSGLLHLLVPVSAGSGIITLGAFRGKTVDVVVVVGRSGNRRDGYLWRDRVRGGSARRRNIMK